MLTHNGAIFQRDNLHHRILRAADTAPAQATGSRLTLLHGGALRMQGEVKAGHELRSRLYPGDKATPELAVHVAVFLGIGVKIPFPKALTVNGSHSAQSIAHDTEYRQSIRPLCMSQHLSLRANFRHRAHIIQRGQCLPHRGIRRRQQQAEQPLLRTHAGGLQAVLRSGVRAPDKGL